MPEPINLQYLKKTIGSILACEYVNRIDVSHRVMQLMKDAIANGIPTQGIPWVSASFLGVAIHASNVVSDDFALIHYNTGRMQTVRLKPPPRPKPMWFPDLPIDTDYIPW